MLLAIALAAPSACTLLVSTDDLSGPWLDAGQGEAGRTDVSPLADADAGGGVEAASCRGLRDLGITTSGTYTLRRDGGRVDAYCEMESFDGGWSVVTEDMIASERAVQDIAPDSPARVTARHVTDLHGGIAFAITVTADNCGVDPNHPGPSHAFTVVDVEPWKEIMATYTFRDHASCWDLFGSPGAPDTNLHAFELSVDRFDREENMARDGDGNVVPFTGVTKMCTDANENFWLEKYASSRRSIRIVQRRRAADEPFGLGVRTDCGNSASWEITDIYVR